MQFNLAGAPTPQRQRACAELVAQPRSPARRGGGGGGGGGGGAGQTEPAGSVVPSGQVTGGGGGGGGGGGHGVVTGIEVPSAQVCIAGGGGGFVAQAASATVDAARRSTSLMSVSLGFGGFPLG